MNTHPDNLERQNSIAYNRKLRGQLKKLHEMLGEEITDLASGDLGNASTYFNEAQRVLKELSGLTAQLSVILLEAKQSKEELSDEEKYDYSMIHDLTNALGNLQFELNRLIKHMEPTDKEQYTKESLKVMERITQVQEQFRAVRSHINDFGSMSNNPEIAQIFAEHEEQSS